MKKLIAITALACLASATYAVEYTDIYKTIKQYSSNADVHIYDVSYQSINKQSLRHVIRDHSKLVGKYKRLKGGDQLFDCDDYAFTFKAMVSCYSLLLGANYECGVITVRQVVKFGGMPAGGYHALNLVLMDGVLVVIEPQTYLYAPLSEYPNRNNIIGLIL